MADEEKGVVQYQARDGQEIKLTPQMVIKYLVSGKADLVTMQEIVFFMASCKARGMNPFIKDCYLIKYTNDPAAIITSIDYYRKRARSKVDCTGWKTGIVVKNLHGEMEYREGTLFLDGEVLLGGWFKAQPAGWSEPMLWTVPLKSYIKRKSDGSVTRFWSEDNQPGQIAKVAESQGLRRLWPDEFQGLYVDAERQSEDAQEVLDQVVKPAAETPQPKVKPEVVYPTAPKEQAQPPKKSFADLVGELKLDPVDANQFVLHTSEAKGATIEEIHVAALDNPKAFAGAFKAWHDALPPVEAVTQTPLDGLIAEVGRLKSKGLKAWIDQNQDRIAKFGKEEKEWFAKKTKILSEPPTQAAGPALFPESTPPPAPVCDATSVNDKWVIDTENYRDVLPDDKWAFLCSYYGAKDGDPGKIPAEKRDSFLADCKKMLDKLLAA